MNNRGFTIPEAILGTLIMVVSLFGLLRAFSFSTGYIEQVGLKRQATAIIQQEYEKIRRFSHDGEFDLKPLAVNDREIFFYNEFNKEARVSSGWLSTIIEEKVDDDGLSFQDVVINLRYEYENKADTISLPGRFYREKQ